MSKINIMADTESGEITASIDGDKIENVANVSMFCYQTYDDEQSVSVDISLHHEKTGDVTKRVHYSSASSEEGKVAIKAGLHSFASKDKRIVKYVAGPNYAKGAAAMLNYGRVKSY